jgi:NADH-quinone oxidoreductase subunit J
MIAQFLFGVMAALVLVTAVLSVISRQLIHAALWLVVTLGAVAGVFLTLGAELLAWVQVLVYVGAVVVLIVFALMLTRRPTGAMSAEVTDNSRIAAAGGALAFLGLGATFVAAFHGERITVEQPGTAARIGLALFSEWVLAFEVLSVVLLAALIAAIVLTRTPESRPASSAGGES